MTETQLAGLSDEALLELAEQSQDPLVRELAARFGIAWDLGFAEAREQFED